MRRFLASRAGYHLMCLAVFVPIMVLFRMGARWSLTEFGYVGLLAFSVPTLGLLYLIGRREP